MGVFTFAFCGFPNKGRRHAHRILLPLGLLLEEQKKSREGEEREKVGKEREREVQVAL